MNKIITLAVLSVFALTIKAQTYIGATTGIDVVNVESTTHTVFQIAPEVGYSFSDNWAVGAILSYGLNSVDGSSLNVLQVMPYVRGTFAKAGIVDFFGEAGAGYEYQSIDGYDASGFFATLRPGIAINFTPKFALIARTNLLTYEHIDETSAVEFSLNKGWCVGVQFKF